VLYLGIQCLKFNVPVRAVQALLKNGQKRTGTSSNIFSSVQHGKSINHIKKRHAWQNLLLGNIYFLRSVQILVSLMQQRKFNKYSLWWHPDN